jgi:ferredoxin-NADP reductase/predicted pyridoxine 5'-phosphate oxidase superfamily flavin-nucleotide-binding protein
MSKDSGTTAVPGPSGWPRESSPYHSGEQAVQDRTGARDFAERIGRQVIRDFMPDQHREFFKELPFVVVGTLDKVRRPWASILVGRPGFLSSPDPRTLQVAARAISGDPINDHLIEDAPIAFVGVQLETRRRNRMNGKITSPVDGQFRVKVDQSFGNCPQYIQAREPVFLEDPSTIGESRPRRLEASLVSDEALALIQRSDTFFIASASPGAGGPDPTEGVDVNHRGGKPDFVRVTVEDGAHILTAPDFIGNFAFNTFGNIVRNPRTGLLFIDFKTGDMLTLTGDADIIWDSPDVNRFSGAQRFLRFRVSEGVFIAGGLPLRWSDPVAAPQIADTGTWSDVDRAEKNARLANTYRPFKVAQVEQESDAVRSLYLLPADDGPVPEYLPGQFLPISVSIPGFVEPFRRTYTISDEPNGRYIRISVKRDSTAGHASGVVSNWLHDNVSVGSIIDVMAPRGDFTLDPASHRPVVLLSAGIGITPMMAMLDHLMGGTSSRLRYPDRRVWFVHAARHGGEHAFASYVRSLSQHRPNLTTHIRYSQPRVSDRAGEDFDSAGRIDAALIRALLPLDDYDFYLCGPTGFMQATYDVLGDLGVRNERIHFEAFGPSSVNRRRPNMDPAQQMAPPVENAQVVFKKSGVTAIWNASAGTLLDLAEQSQISAPWSCRAGNCGSCRTPVTVGKVTYEKEPTAAHDAATALICCGVPSSDVLELDL